MPPVHEYSNWNLRSADTLEEIEPLRKFVFICEGGKTEDYYFKELINFELFLMLHREGAFKNVVLPHERELLENRKVGQRRFAQVLFTGTYGMNPKSNPKIGTLVGDVLTAIEEERNLNHCMDACLTTLTSTVGEVIDTIKDDPFRLP